MKARAITSKIRTAMLDTPVIFLQGARQTGKSTLARSLTRDLADCHYFTLDDAAALTAAHTDPTGFIANTSGTMLIDEVQKAPELFPAIKAAVDADRRPGRFLLTGSANVLLMPQIAESLAGRIEIFTLFPFSQGELDGSSESFVDDLFADSRPSSSSTTTTESMIQRIVAGGYPEIQTRPLAERREAWFQSYVMTILQRDVRDMANIQNFTELPRLLRLIASRSGSLINYADLSRDLGMPQTTLRRYLNLLEITFLIRRVPAWFSNIGKRLVKSPKIYLGDTGLLSHLLAANKDRIKNDPALHGHLLENFVALELLKQISWSTINPQLHHFRTQAGSEVDFLLEDRAGRLVAIEVKRTATIKTKDLRGIQTIREVAGARFLRGCILYMGTNTVPFDSQVSALPISSLWTNATFE